MSRRKPEAKARGANWGSSKLGLALGDTEGDRIGPPMIIPIKGCWYKGEPWALFEMCKVLI